MMQGFYLKNLASVSVVSILFSAISGGTIAEQEPPHMEKESAPILTPSEAAPEGPLPMPEEMKSNVGESTMEAPGMKEEIYQDMLDAETQGVETPSYTLEEKEALDRLNKLREKDQLDGSQLDLSDLPKEDEIAPGILEGEGTPETTASQSSLPTATPTASSTNFGGVISQGSVTPTAWDDEETRAPQKEEDPSDPTSEGQGPGGKHKMGQLRPKGPVIPIIRMGENSEENRGFTIIKPWNS